MRRRCSPLNCVIPVLAAVLGLAAAPAAAEPREEHYTGLAVTYYFGDSTNSAGSADLSLGAMERSFDLHEDATVMHLPVLMVPLVRRGQPMIAPVSAMVGAVQYLGSRRWTTTSTDAAGRPSSGVSKSLSLPDLGAN